MHLNEKKKKCCQRNMQFHQCCCDGTYITLRTDKSDATTETVLPVTSRHV